MKFIALFIFVLSCIRGKITEEVAHEVKTEIIQNSDLSTNILDLCYLHMYGCERIFKLSKLLVDKSPLLKSLVDKIFVEDKPLGIFYATLNYFFPSLNETINTKKILNSSFAKKYFSDNESRSKNIKMFSMFFLKLLQKDKEFKLTSNFIDEQNEITDPELTDILNTDIKGDKDTLVLTLFALNTFMLEVLNTKEELTEYITNILEHFTFWDQIYIMTSSQYSLDVEVLEREYNNIKK